MVVGGIGELTGALKDIGLVSVNQILIEVAARFEIAKFDGDPSVLDTVTQNVNQSVLGDIRLEHLVELVCRLVSIEVHIALPDLWLRGLNELQQHRHIYSPLLAVGALVAFAVAAVVEEVMLDVSLEVFFLETVVAADFYTVIA